MITHIIDGTYLLIDMINDDTANHNRLTSILNRSHTVNVKAMANAQWQSFNFIVRYEAGTQQRG